MNLKDYLCLTNSVVCIHTDTLWYYHTPNQDILYDLKNNKRILYDLSHTTPLSEQLNLPITILTHPNGDTLYAENNPAIYTTIWHILHYRNAVWTGHIVGSMASPLTKHTVISYNYMPTDKQHFDPYYGNHWRTTNTIEKWWDGQYKTTWKWLPNKQSILKLFKRCLHDTKGLFAD